MTETAAYPAAVEDYVKTIYAHTEWQPEPITSSALAARLGLAPSTVTEMVKKLASLGLVDHKPYGAVTLTGPGTDLAMRMVRRHRLIETWLVSHFDYTWDEVHDEAEVLEHVVSDRLLDRVDAQLGYPKRDPHGDPIPAANGTVSIPPAIVLADAAAGASGTVVRISDRDPALLRHLEAEGVVVDAQLTVMGRSPFRGAFAVRVDDGVELDLGDEALSSIWIAEASGDTA
jgi:DtxR family Mn-dependent transcriptional regulator